MPYILELCYFVLKTKICFVVQMYESNLFRESEHLNCNESGQ